MKNRNLNGLFHFSIIHFQFSIYSAIPSYLNYNETIWNGKRQIVVYKGLCAKFQNSELKSKLKATGDAVLAEGAVRDCIWGIGLSMTDPKRLEMEKWRGQNLLGFALMMVRDGI